MKSINSHLSIVLSVFVMLFSFQFTHFVTNVVDAYAAKMLNDYSIIVVASTEIKEEALKEQVVEIRSLSEISSKKILDRLKNDMSSNVTDEKAHGRDQAKTLSQQLHHTH